MANPDRRTATLPPPPSQERTLELKRDRALEEFVVRFHTYPHPAREAAQLQKKFQCGQEAIHTAFRKGVLLSLGVAKRSLADLASEAKQIGAIGIFQEAEVVQRVLEVADHISFERLEQLAEIMPKELFLDERIRTRIEQEFHREMGEIHDVNKRSLFHFDGGFDEYGVIAWSREKEWKDEQEVCRRLRDVKREAEAVGYGEVWQSPRLQETMAPLMEQCIKRRFREVVQILRGDFGATTLDIREPLKGAATYAFTGARSFYERGYDVRVAHGIGLLRDAAVYKELCQSRELAPAALFARIMIDCIESDPDATRAEGPLSPEYSYREEQRKHQHHQSSNVDEGTWHGYTDIAALKASLDQLIGERDEGLVREVAIKCATTLLSAGGYGLDELERKIDAIRNEYHVDLGSSQEAQATAKGYLLYNPDLPLRNVAFVFHAFSLGSREDGVLRNHLASMAVAWIARGLVVEDEALLAYADIDPIWRDDAVERGSVQVFVRMRKPEEVRSFFQHYQLPTEKMRQGFEKAFSEMKRERSLYEIYAFAQAADISREELLDLYEKISPQEREGAERGLADIEDAEANPLDVEPEDSFEEEWDPEDNDREYLRALHASLERAEVDFEELDDLLEAPFFPKSEARLSLLNRADTEFLAGRIDTATQLFFCVAQPDEAVHDHLRKDWMSRMMGAVEEWAQAGRNDEVIQGMQGLMRVNWSEAMALVTTSLPVRRSFDQEFDLALSQKTPSRILEVAHVGTSLFGKEWVQDGDREEQGRALFLEALVQIAAGASTDRDPLYLSEVFAFSKSFIHQPDVQRALQDAICQMLREGDVSLATHYMGKWIADPFWRHLPRVSQLSQDRFMRAVKEGDLELIEQLHQAFPLEEVLSSEGFFTAAEDLIVESMASNQLPADWEPEFDEQWPNYPFSGLVKFCGQDYGTTLQCLEAMTTLPASVMQSAMRRVVIRHLEAGSTYADTIAKRAPDQAAFLVDPEVHLAAERGALGYLAREEYTRNELASILHIARTFGWNPEESETYQRAVLKKIDQLLDTKRPAEGSMRGEAVRAQTIWHLASLSRTPAEVVREHVAKGMKRIGDPFSSLCLADTFRIEWNAALEECIGRFPTSLQAELREYAPRWMSLSLPPEFLGATILMDIWDRKSFMHSRPWLVPYILHPIALQPQGKGRDGVLRIVEFLVEEGVMLREEDARLFGRLLRSMGDDPLQAMHVIYMEFKSGRMSRPLTSNRHLGSFATQFPFDGTVFKQYQAILEDKQLDDRTRRERIEELRRQQPEVRTVLEDPFDVLGLTPLATQQEIKQRYRALVKQFHPDKHPNESDQEAAFKRIVRAYGILSGVKSVETYASSFEEHSLGDGR